jgi:hypothetical protein
MRLNSRPGDYFVDANGCPAEHVVIAGQEVIVHYDDIPESDITSVDGIRVTTPLRTVIDLAPQLGPDDLAVMVRDCLDRGLFTVQEAYARINEPDMQTRRGAPLLRQILSDPRVRA